MVHPEWTWEELKAKQPRKKEIRTSVVLPIRLYLCPPSLTHAHPYLEDQES